MQEFQGSETLSHRRLKKQLMAAWDTSEDRARIMNKGAKANEWNYCKKKHGVDLDALYHATRAPPPDLSPTHTPPALPDLYPLTGTRSRPPALKLAILPH
jgi:hypothetical protein